MAKKTIKMQMFDFGSRTYVMGILNLTPDSFSGDGIYNDIGLAVNKAQRIVEEGADIIDVGGESTRPGAGYVEKEEEIKRVIPVVKELTKKIKIPISVDTRKAEVALYALDNGASIINDISGLCADGKIAGIAAKYNARVVIMHMKGDPRTMQENPVYKDLISEIKGQLKILVEKAVVKGVKRDNIIIDPGIGFGKTAEHNLEILNKLQEFKEIGCPILAGVSRKSFIGKVLGVEPKERIFGTAASVAAAIMNGADIIRVHDVREMKQVAQIVDAIKNTSKDRDV